MIFDWLRRFWRRDRNAEIDRIKLGAIPRIDPPQGYVCEDGEIVHAVAQASAETEIGKTLGTGILVLTSRGIAFIGGKRPIHYTWRQIDSSGARFAGKGFYSINTKRGRTIDFHLTRRWDAEQLYAVDYALNAPR